MACGSERVAFGPSLRVLPRDGRPALQLGRDVHALLGLVFDATTVAAAAAHLRGCAEQRQRCFVSTPNVNFVIAAQRDAAFRDSVLQSDLSLADGAPVVRLARLLGVPLPERVAGADLFEHLRRGDSTQPLKVHFFGGADGVAEQAARALNVEAGGLRCVGHLSPGFGSIESMSSDAIIGSINAAGADFVVVSLGAAKGQAWIQRNRARLAAPIVSHLGAVVNFVAGDVHRAPVWVRRAGLEWCWRILEEPDLWRRYAGDAARLLRLLWTAWRATPRTRLPPTATPARWQPRVDGRLTHFELAGAWSRDDLHPLRQAVADALNAGCDVQFDIHAVDDADAAVLALLALIDRWQQEPRAIVGTVSTRLRARIAACGLTFLLDHTDL